MRKNKKIQTIVVGRKKIKYWHDNFQYYQPNDHVTSDCGIRAVTKALDLTWEDAFKLLAESAIVLKEPAESCDNIDAVLKKHGFLWIPVKPAKGEKRPTVSDFAKKHPEKAICRISSHLVATQDGNYYDIWDCGDKSLYGYWISPSIKFLDLSNSSVLKNDHPEGIIYYTDY